MSSRPATSRWVPVGLGLLLALSLLLRFWYAAADPTSQRVFDERYSLHNVTALWLHERGQPANAYYPGLSFLPQTAVLWGSEQLSQALDAPALSPLGGHGERWSPTGYKLARWLSALYGVLSLYWVFRVGRRLFDPVVGLWAAVILGAVPHHLVSSGMFKPDILVVLLTLMAFEWSLDAVEALRDGDSSPWTLFALAGVGVGLAVAAKYTGVGAAIPLAAGAWATRTPGGRPAILAARPWGLLVAAGAASLVAFLVFNPWIATTLSYLPELLSIYETKGGQAGGTHLEMFGHEAGFLLRHHGVVIVTLAAVGIGLAARRLLHRFRGPDTLGPGMALAFVAGYSLLYAAATTLFKGQNYLPVVPFTSLFAAWALVEGVRLLAHTLGAKMPRPAWPVVATVGAAALLALLYVPLTERAYEEVVPSTAARAASLLAARLQPVEERLVAYEAAEPIWVRSGGARAAMLPADTLPRLGDATLDGADAEVFPAARLEGDGAEPYLRRMTATGLSGGGVLRVEPRFLESRGEPLVVLTHPWRKASEDEIRFEIAASPELAATLRAGFRATPGPRRVSLALELPRLDRMPERPGRWLGEDGRPVMRLGARALPLFLTQGRGRRGAYLTPRFELPPGAGRLPVDFGPLPSGAGGPRGHLVTWELDSAR